TKIHRGKPQGEEPDPGRVHGPHRLLRRGGRPKPLPGRSTTKPGTLSVRTYADWDDARPGFLEVDAAGFSTGIML
ncbi:TPA: hypothetical protein EYH33_07860, partial [Candidatus Bipolaricaulota bacterium]|nr:hypothetical protein [Candidatus Bipolaricaulota bacterium]